MSKVNTTLFSIPVLALLLLAGVTLTANAQAQLNLSGATDASYSLETGAGNDCDDADERCEPGRDKDVSVTRELDKATPAAVEANYNNTRSNRSTIAAPADINICDGVTCADGSCAATADECSAVAEEANEAMRIREGGQTIDAGNVPERTRTAGDTDGDGRPDFRDEDSDGDGLDDGTERAQNHNSSRSNRSEGISVDWGDVDDDGDGLPEVTMRAGGFIKIDGVEGEANGRVNSGEVVCWGRAEDEEGKVYSWGRGLCVAAEASADAGGVANSRIAALQVRGDEVRSWSEAEREAWREYVKTRATTSAEERLAIRAIERTQTDERIREISLAGGEPSESLSLNYEPIKVRYQARLNIFGFIPTEREVAAHIDNNGEVVIDYPWYGLFSRKPDSGNINGLLNSLIDSVGGGGGAGKVKI